MKRKGLALGLALTLTASVLPTSALAATPTFKDMPDNWSTEALEKAVSNGLLQGDGNMIYPQDNLTRAEMATVVNRAFGAERAEDISGFKDVSKEDWFYIEMARAVAMETFQGDGSNLNPTDAITRQEAFAVIARALNIGETTKAPKGYSDLDDIAGWAKGEVYALVEQGYVKGSDGKLNPKNDITRAEFATLMDNIISKYINKAGEYTIDLNGNMMINAEDVVLKDSTIKGDLIIGDGVGEGDVTLDNVKVTGEIIVRGGGTDSLIIKGDSDISSITTAKVKGAVRVASEGNAKIDNVLVKGKDDVVLEGTFKTVNISSDDTKVTARKATMEDVTIEGKNLELTLDKDTSVDKLNLKGQGAKADVSGDVKSVTINKSATKATVNVKKSGEIQTVETDGKGTKVTGQGKVKDVKANADNVNVNINDAKVTAGKNTKGVTSGGETVRPGKTVVSKPSTDGDADDDAIEEFETDEELVDHALSLIDDTIELPVGIGYKDHDITSYILSLMDEEYKGYDLTEYIVSYHPSGKGTGAMDYTDYYLEISVRKNDVIKTKELRMNRNALPGEEPLTPDKINEKLVNEAFESIKDSYELPAGTADDVESQSLALMDAVSDDISVFGLVTLIGHKSDDIFLVELIRGDAQKSKEVKVIIK